LSDRDREEIDATTKQSLRELNASISKMVDVEKLRQDTQNAVTLKKFRRLHLGALGKWAAGGAGHTKSYEQDLDEAKAGAINMHRENVLWYLREKLRACVGLQASMMEKRINREMEKQRLEAIKHRVAPMPDFTGFSEAPPASKQANYAAHVEKQENEYQDELSEEQIQLFEQDNADMLKHYESTLDQVRLVAYLFSRKRHTDKSRTTEKSLIEIAELQNQLVDNLNIQSAHIEQLVADSEFTTDNVGGGNQQLKKATERKSTAKYVFYASCGLSLFLVVWDLVI